MAAAAAAAAEKGFKDAIEGTWAFTMYTDVLHAHSENLLSGAEIRRGIWQFLHNLAFGEVSKLNSFV